MPDRAREQGAVLIDYDLDNAEVGLITRVSHNRAGKSEAGMGVAMGDWNLDGALDLFFTNHDLVTNTLYQNEGGGSFADRMATAKLG